ncbi:MAG: hypothetical protein ACXW1W_02555 [Methylococcaceae bacterium]
MHKINLDEGGIDAARNALLNKNNPQLGGFLQYAAENAQRLLGQ